MRFGSILFTLFLVVPVVEIALFVVVGERIGLGGTLLLVVATALIGSALVSRQGRGQIDQVRRSVAAGGFPGAELAHGAMILVAGALLITPGFLTDAAGFVLLIPAAREGLRRWGARRIRNRTQIL